jgi:transcriptional regulator with XRE-family HTH domain
MPRADSAGSELGRYLKLLRIKNNLTMMQTAESTGITQGYISQIENGIYSPSAKTLAKLARAYRVPEIQLLRKAGIVQLSSSAPSVEDLDSHFSTNLFPSEPLIEVSDSRELMDLLRRGLSSLEYLTDQIRQRGQVASLPTAPLATDQADDAMLGDMLATVYDSSWQPLLNAGGEPSAMRLPAAMCADDPGAFILVAADNAMAPQVHVGDWVLISPAAELQSGDMVAINDRNQIQLRNYLLVDGILVLSPLNPEFAGKSLVMDTRKERVEIVGKALRLVNREL